MNGPPEDRSSFAIFPSNRPKESSNFHKDKNECDAVQVFIYLVDIDGTRGPLVYVPGTNRYDVRSCRPKANRDLGGDASDGSIKDATIEKYYPRDTWVLLRRELQKARHDARILFSAAC